jgi:hypothetical protein
MSFGLTKENEYILLPETDDSVRQLHEKVKGGIENWYATIAIQEAMDLLKNRDQQSLMRKQKVVQAIALSHRTDEEVLSFLKHRDLEIRNKVTPYLISLFY